MHIDQDTTLTDIANAGEAARALLARYSLDFCCQGSRTLGHACDDAGIDVAGVEGALQTLPPPSGRDWMREGIAALVDHVVDACHPETERHLADLEACAEDVTAEAGRALREVVADFVSSVRAQMKEEERDYFTRVRALAEARKGRGPFPLPPFRTIHEHEPEIRAAHARIYARFVALRARCEALRGPGVAEVCRSVDDLAPALLEQLHLENNVLMPRARDLEPNGHSPA